MNAATVSIQREGGEGQIHICEGANTYFKNNSSNVFSCICASANTGPTCMCAKMNSSRFFPACIGFVPGGNEGGPRGQQAYSGQVSELAGGLFGSRALPLPLVRQVCEHPAFCVTSSALFRQNSGRFQSFIRQFAWALFGYFQTILSSFRQS